MMDILTTLMQLFGGCAGTTCPADAAQAAAPAAEAAANAANAMGGMTGIISLLCRLLGIGC